MNTPKARKSAAEVKEVALKAGADLVGIVSAETYDALPKIWVGWTIQKYTKKASEIMSDAESIIVMGFHVWDDMFELAIRKEEEWVYPGYFPLNALALKVINYLEQRGCKGFPFNYASDKRLAQLAGFGNFGKNTLIINPSFGPRIRLVSVLANVEIVPDKPFEEDLCGDCEACVRACPVGALTPYKLDDTKCLVGIHLAGTTKEVSRYAEELKHYEPNFTKNSHLMCMECQKTCKYGTEKH